MKKLLTYFLYLFIMPAMMCIASANAQIIYTDVNPDTTFSTSGATYHLDLNHDGMIDYDISVDSISVSSSCGSSTHHINSYIRIFPLDSNEVLDNSVAYPLPLTINSFIDSNSINWQNSISQTLFSKVGFCAHINTCCLGPSHLICCNTPGGPTVAVLKYRNDGLWNGLNDKYLGLKFHVGLNYYYGWVRISVSGLAVTIKDFAYNSIPGQSISAGETCWFPVNLNVTGNTTFCSNDTINHFTTLTVIGGTSYIWSTGDTTAGLTVSPLQTTNYSVTVSDNSSSCIAILNQSIAIDIIDTSVTVSNFPTYKRLIAHYALSSFYQWVDCTTMFPIPGATDYFYNDSLNGSYAVIITHNGCVDTSSCLSILINGIDESLPSGYFAAYSFNKTIQIKINAAFKLNGDVIVSNMLGQELRKVKIESAETQIKLDNCPAGIYFVTLQMNNVIETKKILLE